MRFRLTHACLGAARRLRAGGARRACLHGGKQGRGRPIRRAQVRPRGAVASNFRKDGADRRRRTGKTDFETPLGTGTLAVRRDAGGLRSTSARCSAPSLRPVRRDSRRELAAGLRPHARAADFAGIQRRSAERVRSHPLRHLAQLELLDLPGAGLRQFGEHDVARHLVAGEVRPAPRDELVAGRGRARASTRRRRRASRPISRRASPPRRRPAPPGACRARPRPRSRRCSRRRR